MAKKKVIEPRDATYFALVDYNSVFRNGQRLTLRKNIEAKRRKKAEKLKIVSARLTQQ